MRVKQIHFFPGLKGTPTQNFSVKAITFERCLCIVLFILQSLAWLSLAFVWIRKYKEETKKIPALCFRSMYFTTSQLQALLHWKGWAKEKEVLKHLLLLESLGSLHWANISVTIQACIELLKIYSVPASHSNFLRTCFYESALKANEKTFICLKGQGRSVSQPTEKGAVSYLVTCRQPGKKFW